MKVFPPSLRLVEVIGERCVLMSAEQEQLDQSKLPHRLPAAPIKGCRVAERSHRGSELWKWNPDGTSCFLKPWITADYDWLTFFCVRVLFGVGGGRKRLLEERVPLREPARAGRSGRQAHLIIRFRIRARSVRTYSTAALPLQKGNYVIHHLMMAWWRRSMRGCREGAWWGNCQILLNTSNTHTAEGRDPYWASIFLLWSQPPGRTELTQNKCTGSVSKCTLKSNNSPVCLLVDGADGNRQFLARFFFFF